MPSEAPTMRVRVTEIFYSLQGEADSAGAPTVFVRLTGCPLRCVYCDTEYAFTGGVWMSFNEVLAEIARHQTGYVTVTGGEPLAQKSCRALLALLCDAGYRVSLETSGSLDISDIDPRVIIVMDIKTPGSGEERRNLDSNLAILRPVDQLKFVITGWDDYEWSRDRVRHERLGERCTIWFSPAFGALEPRQLADWILGDHLQVRLQLQLHKLLWDNEPGR